MISVRPRILILTLYSGEQEFDRCCASIEAQSLRPAEHRIVRDLPNREAHQHLYETIMGEHEAFDVFLKLDADMVLAHDGVLEKIADQFRRVEDLDHLVLGVSDWYTGTDIIGLHAYSGRVSWQTEDERLFVDPDPRFQGRKLVIPHPLPAAALHSPDPSPFHAFQFGVHRAMKACQRDATGGGRRPHAARVHWSYLSEVWHNLERHRDRRLALAVLGADLVFSGMTPDNAGDRDDPVLRKAYDRVEAMDVQTIIHRLEPNWRRPVDRLRRWLSAMSSSMVFLISARAVRDVVTGPVRIAKRFSERREAGFWTDRNASDGRGD